MNGRQNRNGRNDMQDEELLKFVKQHQHDIHDALVIAGADVCEGARQAKHLLANDEFDKLMAHGEHLKAIAKQIGTGK